MSSVFVDTLTIVQQMCDDYKSITGITITPAMTDNAFVIKFFADAGAISSLYSECQRTVNDIFPATASTSALLSHLATRGLATQIQPQQSNGQIQFTATGACSIPVGAQVTRVSDGSVFTTIQSGTLAGAGTLTLYVQSVSTGNDQNLDSLNNPFTLTTSLANVLAPCTNVSLFLDGRDLETPAEMVVRIQAHDQDVNTGGNATAYEDWALEASSEVVTAKCIRLLRGPDTVDVVITSGTTDITAAVESGEPVTRLPSAPLVAQVQAYINALNPVTDSVLVRGPTEAPLNVSFQYSLVTETVSNRSYTDGQILQIIQIYLYSAQPLDVLYPTAIERLVDQAIGSLIKERYCANLGTGVTYYQVPEGIVLTPGTIALTQLVDI